MTTPTPRVDLGPSAALAGPPSGGGAAPAGADTPRSKAPTAAPQGWGDVGGLLRNTDAALAALVVGIVFMMVIPLPTLVVDLLLVANMALALTVLVTAISTGHPLQFSAFPSVLLVMTLFRLGLNVSTTRLILLQGDTGQVVDAFGRFVVGGNLVVGLVVFLILLVVQFVVITNGANRIAEVAARFTLDALPGKQMAIDADLNASLIGEEEARRRRAEVRREADFYGAMDGSSKFVRGDAVAGLVITAVNIVGGLTIGVLQRGLDLTTALETYTILTVGDGLVSQIPALLLSTAAGVMVSRSSGEGDLGAEVTRQLASSPRSLAMVTALVLALVLVPGLPKVPFLAVGALTGGAVLALRRRQAQRAAPAAPTLPTPPADPTRAALEVEPLELEVGYALVPLVSGGQHGDLLGRVASLRRQVASDLGLVVPPVRVRDNLQLAPNAYVIRVRGEEVARGELRLGYSLALGPAHQEAGAPPLQGIATRDPVFGLPAAWVSPLQREQAEAAGYTLVDPATVVLTHLSELVRRHAADLLTRQDVRRMLDRLREEYPAIVDELVPSLLTVGQVHQVLRGLLREQVPIRDLVTIAEALADAAHESKAPEHLLAAARRALARAITNLYRDAQGAVNVLTLEPSLEHRLAQALQPTEHGHALALPPDAPQRLLDEVGARMEALAQAGHPAVLLCSPALRLPLRHLLERRFPSLAVVAVTEIVPQARINVLGVVRGDDGGPKVADA